MLSIEIVICATAGGSDLARCLDAVAAQTSSPVWLALKDDEHRDAAQRTAPDVRVLPSGGPGLAPARNAALAASRADVLAFIEDDVVVAPGWLASLRTAWDAASDRVAAIGGPIELDTAATPHWLHESLHVAFATLDYGPEPLALDPARRTLHGGNLSVRCAALRALGGFWPARGHRDARDWFSEEHHAQRELAEAGWDVAYEPTARVVRVPAPRTLRPTRIMLRRWRYGARMAVAGSRRPAREALSQAASSAAGAALAAAQRRPAVVVERGTRAAENAGVLLGRPIAARDFGATGPRPFGSEIPQAAAATPRPRRTAARHPGAAILLYHRVSEPPNGSDGMCVAPEHFAQQLERLIEHPVLGVEELAELVRAGGVPAGAVALSFDDGYLDTLVNARPQLAAAGVPATVFVATGHVASQRSFFWDELERLLGGNGTRPPQLTLSFPDGARAWRTETPELRDRARRQIHQLIQPASPATIDGVLAELTAWADVARGHDDPRPMTIAELRGLADERLVSVGAHTRRHTNLGFRTEETQRDEIEGSRADLREWLGETPTGFSYPFGIPGVDFDATTRRLVADAGFRYAVANRPGVVSASSDPYALPRYPVPDLGGEQFSAWLAAIQSGRRRG
ncbi:MAG TPA: polysaccharide deacetylase family protein [Solirubrobacteraceae bacterium]